MNLYIVVVGYNEEINLPKLFRSFQFFKNPYAVIYVDQSSNDKSVEIAKRNDAQVYVHPNLGYADPDKKWAVENIISGSEQWVLLLDADEELSQSLALEIEDLIDTGMYDIGNINIESCILGGYGGRAFQKRLFKKNAVRLTEDIHEYIIPISKKVYKCKSILLNNDLKYIGKEIAVFVEKLNRYSDKEILQFQKPSKFFIFRSLFWKPIQWFFGFGIIHKQFLRGIPGLILCILMAYYQFMIYAKLYEKHHVTKKT